MQLLSQSQNEKANKYLKLAQAIIELTQPTHYNNSKLLIIYQNQYNSPPSNSPMSSQDIISLAQQINQVINLQDPLKFSQFIAQSHIYNHPSTIKILSDILASDIFSKEQKVIAASSFELLYQSLLNAAQQVDDRIDKCWQDYFASMMDRSHDDLIVWPYLYNTINALTFLINEMSFNQKNHKIAFLIEKYNQTTFQGKIMLMHAIQTSEEIKVENKFLFIRETIQDFIEETLNVVMNVHDLESVTSEIIDLERDTMEIVFEWIMQLKNLKDVESMKEWDLNFTLCKKQSMISLIKEQLKCVLHVHNGQISYRKSENLVELYDNELINNTGDRTTERMLEKQLEIKRFAINLLQEFTYCFPTTADLNQFDTFQILSIAELLTPIFITELAENNLLKEDYLKQNHMFSLQLKQLIISIFSLLKRTSQFNFMLQIYTQNQQTILYRIFQSYLKTTEHEFQAYESNPTEFISYNEKFITITQELSDTTKEGCSAFLKYFFELNNNALGEYMEFLADSLKYGITGKKSEGICRIKQKGYNIPESEMVYAVLTKVYYVNDQKNNQLFKFIYDRFLDHDIVFKMTGLGKARVLQFLAYAYAKYYAENPLDGLKFIQWTAQSKETSQTEFELVIELLVVAFDYGIPQKVWNYLNNEIERTTKYQIFKLIEQLLNKDMDLIEASCVLTAMKHISNRIMNEFTNRPASYFLQHQGNEYSIFIKCFHLLQQISQYEPIIKKYDVILDEVMDMVDFFHQKEDIERFQFSMEVVNLLNNIVKMQEVVPIEFQRYLKMLQNIAIERKEFGPLVRTYYLILQRAGETFQSSPYFLKKIKDCLQNILLEPQNWHHQKLIIESLFLLSNILLVYPSLCQQTRQVFLITESVLQEEKKNTTFNYKLCASILIYWMAGEYAFGNYELGKLAECKIDIFRDEFGLMFAQCLKKLIEKHYQTQSLQTLLKLAIKLLDNEIYYKKQKNYRGPIFTIKLFKKELKNMDAFEEIAHALEFLKGKLDRETYGRAIDFMRQEYGSEALSKLLSVRVFDCTKQRVIYSVKK